MKKIMVVMGSDSDLPVMEKAIDTLKDLNVPYTVHVLSAHRTPDETRKAASEAEENGYGVIIAAAGMAAHLAGAFAAGTVLPVIGIPVKSSCFDGMDALLSTVQMPPGMPVATVGVNAAKNAALLACQIIALDEPELTERLKAMREDNKKKILEKNGEVNKKYSNI